MKHLQDLYGLNPDIPHLAFQFPRLPPGVFSNSMFRVRSDDGHTKKQFLDKSGTINQQLQGFPAHVSAACSRPPVNELYDCPSRTSVVYKTQYCPDTTS